jgi:hypothetical protein
MIVADVLRERNEIVNLHTGETITDDEPNVLITVFIARIRFKMHKKRESVNK